MAVDIDEVKVARSEIGLWLAWTLATAAALLLGFIPFALLFQELDLLLLRVLVPLWAGLLVGVFQWLVLRPYLTHAFDWVLHGGAGWALGYALGLMVIQLLGVSPLGMVVGYALFGAIVAGLQWPMLRVEIPNVLAWVLASVIGWALGAYLAGVVVGLAGVDGELSRVAHSAITAAVTGLVAGAITGLVLVWIARQPDRGAPPATRAATGENAR